MEPLFSKEQLHDMNKENMIALLQAHQKKQESRILLPEETST